MLFTRRAALARWRIGRARAMYPRGEGGHNLISHRTTARPVRFGTLTVIGNANWSYMPAQICRVTVHEAEAPFQCAI